MTEVYVVTDMDNHFVDVFASKEIAQAFVRELRVKKGRSLFIHACALEDG